MTAEQLTPAFAELYHARRALHATQEMLKDVRDARDGGDLDPGSALQLLEHASSTLDHAREVFDAALSALQTALNVRIEWAPDATA